MQNYGLRLTQTSDPLFNGGGGGVVEVSQKKSKKGFGGGGEDIRLRRGREGKNGKGQGGLRRGDEHFFLLISVYDNVIGLGFFLQIFCLNY